MEEDHSEQKHHEKEQHTVHFKDYLPLFIIIAVAFFGAFAFSQRMAQFTWKGCLSIFMGLFFLELSMFKLFDLKGFIQGFSLYDFITQHFRPYAFIYPFIEMGLAFLYLAAWAPYLTNLATICIMSISAFGVVRSLVHEKNLACACMGTYIRVPLTTISVVENLGMGLMAFFMLF